MDSPRSGRSHVKARTLRLSTATLRAPPWQPLKSLLPAPKAVAVSLDLAIGAQIPAVVAEVIRELGCIDILVHSAGIGMRTKFLDASEAEWDRVMAINVKGPFLMMQHVASHMVARGEGGKIVNVASRSAFRAQSHFAYAAAKAGLVQLTRSVAAELARAIVKCCGFDNEE